MKAKMFTKNQQGFTLIELMIVVGIIGILVAIAAPNFSRYQSKARQSEAKIALAAIYGAEKSFYSEYSAYIGSTEAIGYAPEGARRYYLVGWTAAPTGATTGYSGSTLVPNYVALNNPFVCSSGASTGGTATAADSQSFVAVASGCIRQAQPNYDNWNMNETKVIQNNAVSL